MLLPITFLSRLRTSRIHHIRQHVVSDDNLVVINNLLREIVDNTQSCKLCWKTTTYQSQLAYVAQRNDNLLLLVPQAPMETPRLLLRRAADTTGNISDSDEKHLDTDVVDVLWRPYSNSSIQILEKLHTAVRTSVLRHRSSLVDTLALFLAPEPPPQRKH